MKKGIVIALILVLGVFSFTACGDSNEPAGPAGQTGNEDFVLYDFDLADYVELGTFIGIEVPVTYMPNPYVSEEQLYDELQMRLRMAGDEQELTSGYVTMGDSAHIDFIGTEDGVPFDGGTGHGFDLVIGSGMFIPGFEEGLIGAAIGDTVVIDIRFPDDYFAEHLAGVEVQFEVTIHNVTRFVLPELTDEFVMANTEFSSIAEFEESVKEDILEQRAAVEAQFLENFIWDSIVSSTNIIRHPEREVQSMFDLRKQETLEHAESAGISWDDFLEFMGMTEEELNEALMESVMLEVTFEMILFAIVRQEGIELTEEDYLEGKVQLLSQHGYETEAEFIAIHGMTFEEAHGRRTIELVLMYEIVMEIAKDNMIIVE